MNLDNGLQQLRNDILSLRISSKKIIFAMSIAASVMLVSCKDDGSKNSAEAARYSRSAATYLQQGQLRAAVLEAKNAVEKDPKNSQGYILLAKIYNQLGSYAGTQKMLESTIKKMPEVALELADAYFANKKYRSAINVLTDFNADSSLSVEDKIRKQVLLARSAIYLGDANVYSAAVAALTSIAEAKTDLTLLEAESLIAKGQAEDASAKLDAIPQEALANVKTVIILGGFALQRGELEKAETYFSKALGLLPNTDVMTVDKSRVLSQLTEVLTRQGKASEAYRYQKILAEANPESQGAQQKFNDAMEYYRQGKFAEASQTLTELREQFPQDKNTAMLLGLIEYQQGKNEQAVALFDKFIDPETAAPTIIEAAALAKYRSNQTEEAVELLKKAAASQPNNAEILATYGLALLDKDPVSVEAERSIEKSLALNPKQHRLRLALAKRDLAAKKPAQALAQLKKAYSDDQLDLVIQQSYFRELINQDKKDDLKKEVAEFQKNYPTNARGAFLEGWYKIIDKDYSGAQVAFEKALATKGNTEKVLSYSGLAQVFETQKQPQKALEVWQTVIEEDPTQVPAYGQWMKLVGALKKVSEAGVFLSDLEKKTDKWQPSVVYSQLLFSQNQFAEAIAHIDIGIERSGNNAQVKQIAANLYQSYGRYLEKEKKITEARTYLMKALNFFPANMNFLAAVVEFEIRQKNIPEAQKLLDQFSTAEDVAAEHAFLQGTIRIAEGNDEAASKLFLESWNKKPMEVVAETIYKQYQKANQKEQMAAFIDQWVDKLPKSPRPTLMKAVRAQENKNIAEAVKWYEKTIELAPNMPAALNNLAWIYYEQKNPKAVELGKRAYQLAPENAAIMDTYGWILVESDQVDEGLAILERAVVIDSSNKEISEHLKAAKAKKK